MGIGHFFLINCKEIMGGSWAYGHFPIPHSLPSFQMNLQMLQYVWKRTSLHPTSCNCDSTRIPSNQTVMQKPYPLRYITTFTGNVKCTLRDLSNQFFFIYKKINNLENRWNGLTRSMKFTSIKIILECFYLKYNHNI